MQNTLKQRFSKAFLLLPVLLIGMLSFDLSANTIDPAKALDQHAGKWRYVDFWASWCAPCQASFPFMNQLQQQFQAQNFTVLAVNLDENIADAKNFLQKTPANFPIIFDANGELPQKFHVQAMPTSFLINPNGQVVWQHQGFLAKDTKNIEHTIQQFLRGN